MFSSGFPSAAFHASCLSKDLHFPRRNDPISGTFPGTILAPILHNDHYPFKEAFMKNFPYLRQAAWLLAFTILLLLPCSQATALSGLAEALNGNDFAVMPCQLGKPIPDTPSEKKAIIDCTLSELCFLEGNPLSDAADIVTNLLQREMMRRFGAGVLPLDQVRKDFDLHPPEATETLRQAAVKLGRQLGVDYVLASTLWRFDDRLGSQAGAKKPASVAFAVFLIDVRDGKIYWRENLSLITCWTRGSIGKRA